MEDNKSQLALIKSGLFVADGALEKRDPSGNTVSRHEICNISHIRIVNRTEYLGILAGIALIALAGVCKVYLESPLWGWVSAIILLALAGFAFLMSRPQQVEIMINGSSVKYDLNDLPDSNVGFVTTLSELVNGKRSPIDD